MGRDESLNKALESVDTMQKLDVNRSNVFGKTGTNRIGTFNKSNIVGQSSVSIGGGSSEGGLPGSVDGGGKGSKPLLGSQMALNKITSFRRGSVSGSMQLSS